MLQNYYSVAKLQRENLEYIVRYININRLETTFRMYSCYLGEFAWLDPLSLSDK